MVVHCKLRSASSYPVSVLHLCLPPERVQGSLSDHLVSGHPFVSLKAQRERAAGSEQRGAAGSEQRAVDSGQRTAGSEQGSESSGKGAGCREQGAGCRGQGVCCECVVSALCVCVLCV